tara:strand:+ start:92 stop:466 length:375 start_codon:yes stop_codon:yes gene_type:complete
MTDTKIKILFIIICILQLFYLWQYRSSFNFEILTSSFKENAGITKAVSPEIIETNEILIKNNLKEFNLSKGFRNSHYLYQRTLEFNYPIRMNDLSEYLLFLKEEQIPSACNILESGKYLKLVKC